MVVLNHECSRGHVGHEHDRLAAVWPPCGRRWAAVGPPWGEGTHMPPCPAVWATVAVRQLLLHFGVHDSDKNSGAVRHGLPERETIQLCIRGVGKVLSSTFDYLFSPKSVFGFFGS